MKVISVTELTKDDEETEKMCQHLNCHNKVTHEVFFKPDEWEGDDDGYYISFCSGCKDYFVKQIS